MATQHPEDYYCVTHTVTAGAPQTAILFEAHAAFANRELNAKPIRFLRVVSDKDLYVRVNAADNPQLVIDVSVDPTLEIPLDAMRIRSVYLATVGACGSGDATVEVTAV